MTTERTATAAVSARKMRLPSHTVEKPFSRASAASRWEKPPSEPTTTAVEPESERRSAVLPPATYKAEHGDWYSENGIQICYLAHGNETEYASMVETASQVLYETLLANKNANGISFMHEDDDAWCGCSACSASKKKYGADSYIARCACVAYGSSETVFYVAAVYFASVKEKKLAVPIAIALCANFIALVFGCFLCRFF